MLPKINRFTSKRFDRSFRNSKKYGKPPFMFLVSPERYESKCAIVIGKKITKSSVKRNRLRRQMYDMMKRELVPFLQGRSVICLYKGPEILQNGAVFLTAIEELKSRLQFPSKSNRSTS